MIDTTLIPGTRSALVSAARDRKHRPLSHPLIGGKRPESATNEPRPAWDGTLLRKRRVALGWSQLQLAEAVGVTRVAVSWWESGQPPSAAHRDAIERLVGRLT